MSRKVFALCILAVISLQAVWGRDLAFGIGAEGGVMLVRDNRFPLKVQPWAAMGAGAELSLFKSLSSGLALLVHNTWPSSLSGGVIYRGFSGIELRLHLAYKSLLLSAPNPLIGLAGWVTARLDRYTYTELTFFYPGAGLAPLLEWQLGGNSVLLFSLPATLFFRRDLQLSLSLGLSIGWKIYP